jgi:hypothetical protein
MHTNDYDVGQKLFMDHVEHLSFKGGHGVLVQIGSTAVQLQWLRLRWPRLQWARLRPPMAAALSAAATTLPSA